MLGSFTHSWGKSLTAAALGLLAVAMAVPGIANARSVRQPLVASGADADATGKAALQVKSKKGVLTGQLTVQAKKLDAGSYEVTIDGVRIGTLEANTRGKGKARFRTSPRSDDDQLLGVDPRGRAITLVDASGIPVLLGTMTDDSPDDDVRCCLPDDSGPECEDRTAAECAAEGGVDLGPGSCLPNPCAGTTPGTDVVCCLPDDSGPECEDRTAAECSAQGGVSLGAGTCTPEPCAPTPPPDGDVRCCLPDDSGTECEDRTAAECTTLGGINLGPGSCTPNPCFPGGSTSTTLPATPVARVTCETRSDRSRASVDGNDLPSGTYTARLTSGANVATSAPAPTVGDEVEFDFDSEPDDIAAGATAIAADFIQGDPPSVTGEILDGGGAVIASATVLCEQR
jgi:hypothetical protein